MHQCHVHCEGATKSNACAQNIPHASPVVYSRRSIFIYLYLISYILFGRLDEAAAGVDGLAPQRPHQQRRPGRARVHAEVALHRRRLCTRAQFGYNAFTMFSACHLDFRPAGPAKVRDYNDHDIIPAFGRKCPLWFLRV